MFERYYVKPATVDRIVANWLAPQIERYVEWMESQGYAARNVYRRVPILCQFGDFAKQNGITEVSGTTALVEKFAAKWLADHGRNCRTAEARSKVAEDERNPIRQMLMLAATGCVSANRQHKPMPFQAEAPRFLQYLLEERGQRKSSVRHYVHHLHRLAGYLSRAGVISLMTLSPPLLAAFIIDSRRLSRTTTRAWNGRRACITPSPSGG